MVPAKPALAALTLSFAGVIFASLGVAGRLRQTRAGCGCLGSERGSAFGVPNILAGVGFVAVAGVGMAMPTSPNPIVTAGFMTVLCVWSHRHLIRAYWRAA